MMLTTVMMMMVMMMTMMMTMTMTMMMMGRLKNAPKTSKEVCKTHPGASLKSLSRLRVAMSMSFQNNNDLVVVWVPAWFHFTVKILATHTWKATTYAPL